MGPSLASGATEATSRRGNCGQYYYVLIWLLELESCHGNDDDGDMQQMEVLDASEYWGKMERFKSGAEQEMVIKRNFSRNDQQTLYEMAYELGLHL